MAELTWKSHRRLHGQFRVTNRPNLHVFGLEKETGAHRGNTHTAQKDPDQPVGLKPRTFLLWGNSANHCTIMLPKFNTELLLYCNWFSTVLAYIICKS